MKRVNCVDTRSYPLTDFDSFWRFSLAVYGRPNVAAALQSLQNSLGADVNVLLLCCWASLNGLFLNVDACRTEVEAWQGKVVTRLRSAHSGIRTFVSDNEVIIPQIEQLRRQIGDLELEAERIEQAILAMTIRDGGKGIGEVASSPPNTAVNYLFCYLAGVQWTESSLEDLITLLITVFPDADHKNLRQFVNQAVSQSGIDQLDVSN